MLGIVVSRADSASTHIAEHLLDLADWENSHDASRPDGEGGGTVYRSDGITLRVFDELHIYLEGVEQAFDADLSLLAFASRHAGDTGALLSAHHTGNFGYAEFGGSERTLARAAPNAHKRVLDAFRAECPPGYEVATECTHHGPTDIETPSLFCELGSDEAQWNDPDGARAVARAILALRRTDPDRERTLAGFGGGHYTNRFRRILRDTDWAVGHVGAAWALSEMGAPERNEAVLKRAMERSGARHALVDGRSEGIETVLDELGYRVVSETWVRETSGVSLDLVEALENRLGSVAEGLRFGDLAAEYEASDGSETGNGDSFTIASLPASLVAEARGIDPERTRETVATRTLAFDTTEGGTNVAGRVALADRTGREGIVDALADVLTTKYDTVERGEEEIVARETAFDPERARDLGVPDGPAFGKLASGEEVKIDGREVTPEDVHTERASVFDLI